MRNWLTLGLALKKRIKQLLKKLSKIFTWTARTAAPKKYSYSKATTIHKKRKRRIQLQKQHYFNNNKKSIWILYNNIKKPITNSRHPTGVFYIFRIFTYSLVVLVIIVAVAAAKNFALVVIRGSVFIFYYFQRRMNFFAFSSSTRLFLGIVYVCIRIFVVQKNCVYFFRYFYCCYY